MPTRGEELSTYEKAAALGGISPSRACRQWKHLERWLARVAPALACGNRRNTMRAIVSGAALAAQIAARAPEALEAAIAAALAPAGGAA